MVYKKVCTVPLCPSKAGSVRLSFHEIPSENKLREKWIQLISRVAGKNAIKDWAPGERAAVCSRHFKQSDFVEGCKRAKLKKNTVPSQFLESPNQTQPKWDEIRNTSPQKCAVCSSTKNIFEDVKECRRQERERIFQRFCETFLPHRFHQNFGLSSSSLLCSKCLKLITSTMDTKGKMDKVESHVQTLQLSILKELRKIQEFVKQLNSQLLTIHSALSQGQGNHADLGLQTNFLKVISEIREFYGGIHKTFGLSPKQVKKFPSTLLDNNQLTEVKEEGNKEAEDDLEDNCPNYATPSAPDHSQNGFTEFAKGFLFRQVSENISLEKAAKEEKTPGFLLNKLTVDRRNSSIEYDPSGDLFHLKGNSLKINDDELSISCCQCNFKFNFYKWTNPKGLTIYLGRNLKKFSVRDHLFNFHVGNHTCPLCSQSKAQYTSRGYRQHLLRHNNPCLKKKPTCDICGRPFSKQSSLQIHKWSHKNSEERGKASKTEKKMLRKLLGRKQFKCSTNTKTNSIKRIVQKPPKLKRTPTDLPIPCEKCAKRFKTKNGLTRHLKNIHKDLNRQEMLTILDKIETQRPIQCSTCGKAFENLSKLNRHEDSHKQSEERERLICQFCGVSVIKSSIQVHMFEKHLTEEEKRFHCQQCGKRFIRHCNLEIHIKKCKEKTG